MHLLDDLDGLSTRARHLLLRTGRRVPPDPDLEARITHAALDGKEVARAPSLLAIRREGFALRYGGLRYTLRRLLIADGKRHDLARDWDFTLETSAWSDPAGGWHFDWRGEHVAAPVSYVLHTDGRVGAHSGSRRFLEIAPSVPALIESHALADEFAQWDRCRRNVDDVDRLGAAVAALVDVPEASGPTVRWRISPTLAFKEFQVWADEQPRPWHAVAWSRGDAANRLLEQA
jgi:hypothetical protein